MTLDQFDRCPNILFVTLDALRADRLTDSGSGPSLQFLSSLRNASIRFTRAYATAPNTPYSFPAIVTGSYPLSHGGPLPLGEGRTPIAERLPSAYTTLCYQTNPHLSYLAGYHRGYDRYREFFDYGHSYKRALTEELRRFARRGWVGISEAAVEREVVRQLDAIIGRYRAKLEAGEGSEPDRKRLKQLRQERRRVRSDPFGYVQSELELPTGLPPVAAIKTILSQTNDSARSMVRPTESADTVVDRVLEEFESDGTSEPYFIWTHFMEPHSPYIPGGKSSWSDEYDEYLPEGDRLSPKTVREQPEQHRPQLYDGCLRYLDEQLERLYRRATTELSNLAVVVTADHGELLGENGTYGHPLEFHETLLRVPLFCHPPEADLETTGETRTQLCSHVDLHPTVFGRLADCAGPDRLPGVDLFTREREVVLAELSDMPIVHSQDQKTALADATLSFFVTDGDSSTVYSTDESGGLTSDDSPPDAVARRLRQVRSFDRYTEGINPLGEGPDSELLSDLGYI